MSRNEEPQLPDSIEAMNDEIIISFFSDKHGCVSPVRTRQAFLDKYPVVKAYLENRYEEFHGYTYTLQCIFLHKEELPRCENCGKVLDRADKRWCNVHCQLTDKKFIAERDAKMDYQAALEKRRQTCLKKYGVDHPMRRSAEGIPISKKMNICETKIPGPVSDEMILNLFTKQDGSINPARMRTTFIERFAITNPHVMSYLEERYEDFQGYRETIKRIIRNHMPESASVPSPVPAPFDDATAMTDEDIIRFFSDRHGKINPNKTRKPFLAKYPEIKIYLENRYEEFHGYTYTLQCIFLGLSELPRCEHCGKILDHATHRWCSIKCQLTDPVFVQQREEHVDYEARSRKFRQTCQERYGVNAPAQNPEILAKMLDGRDHLAIAAKVRETVREKYGVDCVFQLESVKQKGMETKLHNRPDDPCNHRQQEQTMLERYGVKSALCKGELRDKGSQTKLARYGNSGLNVAAVAETKRRRYGDPHYNNAAKARQTCLERYGVPFVGQIVDFAHRRTKTYLWHGKTFDSMPELAYYIYQIDHGSDVVCEPVAIPYEHEGVTHMYIPDFSVDGQLTEIKGDHFFEDGRMINPFGRDMDDLFEAKHQCMLNNGVNIITDFQEYMQYVRKTYGHDFLRRCKVPRTLSLDYLQYPQSLTPGNINIAVKRAQWRVFYKNEIQRWEENHNRLRLRLYENRLKYLGKEPCDLTHYEILRGLKIGGFVKGYSRFNPKIFQQFLDDYRIASVYDPCAGWGERMLVTYAQGIPYLGVDINDALLPGYEALIDAYGMEDQQFLVADSSTYVPEAHYDAVFTCPPYFNQEIYSSQGAENLSRDAFLDWWRATIRCALSVHPRYVAYQANQKTKEALNQVMVDMGLVLVAEMDLPREASHFTHDTKREYESIEIFTPRDSRSASDEELRC